MPRVRRWFDETRSGFVMSWARRRAARLILNHVHGMKAYEAALRTRQGDNCVAEIYGRRTVLLNLREDEGLRSPQFP